MLVFWPVNALQPGSEHGMALGRASGCGAGRKPGWQGDRSLGGHGSGHRLRGKGGRGDDGQKEDAVREEGGGARLPGAHVVLSLHF